PPRQERRVEQAPVRNSAPSPVVAPRDSVRPVAARNDSSGTAASVQKAETTAKANVPPIAPPTVSESPAGRQPVTSLNTPIRTPAEEVTGVIQSYARAL